MSEGSFNHSDIQEFINKQHRKFEDFKGGIHNASMDLDLVNDALFSVYDNLPALRGTSEDGVVYLLRLISNDLASINDDIQRKLEGKCSIRDAAFSALRPPESWEEATRTV